MTLKSQIRNLVLPVLLLLLSSCVDSINNLSKESYMADGFSSAALTRDGVAITPTVAGSGTAQEALTIGTLLDAAMIGKSSSTGSLLTESRSDRKSGKTALSQPFGNKWNHTSRPTAFGG